MRVLPDPLHYEARFISFVSIRRRLRPGQAETLSADSAGGGSGTTHRPAPRIHDHVGGALRFGCLRRVMADGPSQALSPKIRASANGLPETHPMVLVYPHEAEGHKTSVWRLNHPVQDRPIGGTR